VGIHFTFLPLSGILASSFAFVATSLELPPEPEAIHRPQPLTLSDFARMDVRIDAQYPGLTLRFAETPLPTQAPAPLGLDDALLKSISGDLPHAITEPLSKFELEKPFLSIEFID